MSKSVEQLEEENYILTSYLRDFIHILETQKAELYWTSDQHLMKLEELKQYLDSL